MTVAPIPQRSCGDCAMCCHLGEIVDFKPFNQWCTHCSSHQRCDIYESRPQLCRDFHCHYLLSDLSEAWFPRDCGFIVATYANPPRLLIAADPARPASWRQSPFIEQLHHWAQQGAVQVRVEDRTFAVYPDTIEDLGVETPDSVVVILEKETTMGRRYRAARVPRPQLA